MRAVQYSTVQYSTVQYSTVQYSKSSWEKGGRGVCFTAEAQGIGSLISSNNAAGLQVQCIACMHLSEQQP